MNANVNLYDQAGDLRRMVHDNKPDNKLNKKQPKLHTLSILSGKGGVGKSNIAAALSFALADFGKRVVLIDADLGMANLDILCGVDNARYSIADLISGSRNLNEILVHFRPSARAVAQNGSVALLPGGVGLKGIADLDDAGMERLFSALSGLELMADYVIMDAGAGIHSGVLSFAYASEITILVTTPEPTAIRDAYGVIKSLGASAWQSIEGSVSGLMLVVNMATSSREASDVAERIRLASMQFLGNAPVYLGYVLADDVIAESVRNRKIFYRTYPDASASICVRNLAGELLKICDGENVRREAVPENGTVRSFFRRLVKSLFSEKN